MLAKMALTVTDYFHEVYFGVLPIFFLFSRKKTKKTHFAFALVAGSFVNMEVGNQMLRAFFWLSRFDVFYDYYLNLI